MRQVIIMNPLHLPTAEGEAVGDRISVGTGDGTRDVVHLVVLGPGQSFIGYPRPGSAIVVAAVEADAPQNAAAGGV